MKNDHLKTAICPWQSNTWSHFHSINNKSLALVTVSLNCHLVTLTVHDSTSHIYTHTHIAHIITRIFTFIHTLAHIKQKFLPTYYTLKQLHVKYVLPRQVFSQFSTKLLEQGNILLVSCVVESLQPHPGMSRHTGWFSAVKYPFIQRSCLQLHTYFL